MLEKCAGAGASCAGEGCALNLKKVFEFADTAPLDELRFILKAADMNKHAAEVSFTGEYGHSLGRLLRGDMERHIMGDGIPVEYPFL